MSNDCTLDTHTCTGFFNASLYNNSLYKDIVSYNIKTKELIDIFEVTLMQLLPAISD
jgi:hypothetical protein